MRHFYFCLILYPLLRIDLKENGVFANDHAHLVLPYNANLPDSSRYNGLAAVDNKIFGIPASASQIFVYDPNANQPLRYLEETLNKFPQSGVFGGSLLAFGYLLLRFLTSSSNVTVSSIIIYILVCINSGRIISFFYEGFLTFTLYSWFIELSLLIFVWFAHKNRKNKIDYYL